MSAVEQIEAAQARNLAVGVARGYYARGGYFLVD
jgi:hypothetical protein